MDYKNVKAETPEEYEASASQERSALEQAPPAPPADAAVSPEIDVNADIEKAKDGIDINAAFGKSATVDVVEESPVPPSPAKDNSLDLSSIPGLAPASTYKEFGPPADLMNGVESQSTSSESMSLPGEGIQQTGMAEAFLYNLNQGMAPALLLPAYDESLAMAYSGGDPVKRQQFVGELHKYDALLKSEHGGMSKFGDIVGETLGTSALMAATPGTSAYRLLGKASLSAKAAYSSLMSGLVGAQKATVKDGIGAAPGGAIEGAVAGGVGEVAGTGIVKVGDYAMTKVGFPLMAAILGPRDMPILKRYIANSENIHANTLIQDMEGGATLENMVLESQSSGRLLTNAKNSMEDANRAFKETLKRTKEDIIGKREIDAVSAANEISGFVSDLKQKIISGSDEAYKYLDASGQTARVGDIVKTMESARNKFKGSLSDKKDQAYLFSDDYISKFKRLTGYTKEVDVVSGVDVFGVPIITKKTVTDPNVPVSFAQLKTFIKDLDLDGSTGSYYAAIKSADFPEQKGIAAKSIRSAMDDILKADKNYANKMLPVSDASSLHEALMKRGFGDEQKSIDAIMNMGKIRNKVVLDSMKELDKITNGRVMAPLTRIIQINRASKNKSMWRNLPEMLAERDRAVAGLKNDIMLIGQSNPELAKMIISDIDSKSSTEILEETIDEMIRDFSRKRGDDIGLLSNPEGTFKSAVFAKQGEKIVARQNVSKISEIVGRGKEGYGTTLDDYAAIRAFNGESTAGSRAVNAINIALDKWVPGVIRAPLGLMIDVFGKGGTKFMIRALAERGYGRSMLRSTGLPSGIKTTLAREYAPEAKDFVIRKGDQYYNQFMESVKADKSISAIQKLKIMRQAEDGITVPNIWESVGSEESKPSLPMGPAIDKLVNTMGG